MLFPGLRTEVRMLADNELLNRGNQAFVTFGMHFFEQNMLLIIDLLSRSIPKRVRNHLAFRIPNIQIDSVFLKDFLALSQASTLTISLN